ncbi:MAG: transcriptional repressor [Deltaproteobacteria bacterium]|jgi:Fur family zinc uptake transcriptional regulator|nr:transcriptional repressor [Deltaproteobacteria bacterium]
MKAPVRAVPAAGSGGCSAAKDAEELCARHGVRLTAIRRKIFKILLQAGAPLKAYDIIDRMREDGRRITPATMYRTLEFLLQQGLAHRINALNAYVPCTAAHDSGGLLLFVCSDCQKASELNDPVLYDSLRARLGVLGFSLDNASIEIQGACPSCSAGKSG